MIVFCQVHAKCYGELEPVGGVLWLCNLCRPGAPDIPPPCCLCPVIGSLVPNNIRNNIFLSLFVFLLSLFFFCAKVSISLISDSNFFTRGCYEAYNRWTLGSPCLCNMDTRYNSKCFSCFSSFACCTMFVEWPMVFQKHAYPISRKWSRLTVWVESIR